MDKQVDLVPGDTQWWSKADRVVAERAKDKPVSISFIEKTSAQLQLFSGLPLGALVDDNLDCREQALSANVAHDRMVEQLSQPVTEISADTPAVFDQPAFLIE